MHPYNEPDRVEKTFFAVGVFATAVFVMAVCYGFFFLK